MQLGTKATPVALAAALRVTPPQRWAIVSNSKGSVKDLAGKRLAIVKGAGAADPKFVSNVVLAGDLDAQKHFKLVPGAQRGVRPEDAGGQGRRGRARAAGPRAQGRAGALTSSSKVPGAVLVGMRGDADDLTKNLQKLEAVAPFGAFVAVQGQEFEDFRKLVQQRPAPPPARPRRTPPHCGWRRAPVPSGLQPVLPSFADALDVSASSRTTEPVRDRGVTPSVSGKL